MAKDTELPKEDDAPQVSDQSAKQTDADAEEASADGKYDNSCQIEIDTMRGDIRDHMLRIVKTMPAAWPSLTEQQQTDLANALWLAAGDITRAAVRAVTDYEFPRCVVHLGEIKIVGGDKARIEGKIVADNVPENRDVLGEHVNRLVTLLCIDSNEFHGHRGDPEIDKDEPELPIMDGSEAAGAAAEETEDGKAPGDDIEALIAKAQEIVRREGKASTSFLQRRLAVSYNKAAKIIGAMEERGVVTAADDKGRREVVKEDA